ncbi:phage/plasmid primase, P4 family [Mesorhizobium sp. M0243]|uniref:phage/plasmid primase, P4 family n=1 Tax=Mesorhizobium sp. M0243 TaxID=2956925 RepID=UPI003334A8E6
MRPGSQGRRHPLLPQRTVPRIASRLATALDWLLYDVPILLVRPKDKSPLPPFSSKRTLIDAPALREAFRKNPNANFGIVTGLVSELIVLDVDGPKGQASLQDLVAKHGPLPPTVTVNTARGHHYYFFHDGQPVRNSASGLGEGLDVRGEGGYVVGPSSVHPSGAVYGYVQDRALGDVNFADLPAWLLNLLIRAPSDSAMLSPDNQKVAQGTRNSHLMSLAGRLRNSGLSEEALLAALEAENQIKCEPPLGAAEISNIARSIGRYAVSAGAGADPAEAIATAVLDREFAGGDHLLSGPDGQFWHFNGRFWVPISPKSLRKRALTLITALAGPKPNTASLLNQFETVLHAKVAADGDPLGFMTDPRPVINCRNGEVWLAHDGAPQLKPHSFNSYLRYCLDVDYDPRAKAPLFDQALADIFAKSLDPSGMASFWNEIVGYVIQPDRRIASIFIFSGDGNNGKTTLVNTLVKLLGKELVASMRVQDLDRSQFSTGNLLGKLLFLDDDVKKGTRLPDGDLKRISEAKPITGERKFGPTFTFTVRAVPMLLCNAPPSLADLTFGMLRRLVVVPFARTFTEDEVKRTPFPAILASEMSGVLNRALEGYQRVVQRGHQFAPPKAVADAKSDWLISANPVPAFLAEKCDKTGQCQVRVLYSAFQSWSTDMGYTLSQQQANFRRSVENLGFKAKHGRDGDIFLGLNLKGASVRR